MSTPMLPGSEPDYQVSAPMDHAEPHAPSFRIQRAFPFLRKFWWLPILTAVLSLGGAAAYVFWKPPTYVSKGKLWQPDKMRLPESSLFAEEQNFVGTQTELLQSERLKALALDRLKLATNFAIPRDKQGVELPVAIRVAGSAKSSVFQIEATGSKSDYTQLYLDALMNVYLEYKKNVRQSVSGGTLNSISAQVLRMEQDLKIAQDALTAFQRTNSLAILEEEGRASGGYLARLRTQLSDLQLENKLLPAVPTNSGPAALPGTNAGLTPVEAAADPGSPSPVNAPPEYQAASKEVELLQMQRAKLSRYLRPKHPKIVRLDADIERSQKLVALHPRVGGQGRGGQHPHGRGRAPQAQCAAHSKRLRAAGRHGAKCVHQPANRSGEPGHS